MVHCEKVIPAEPPRLVIERPVRQSILAGAERAYPEEFCGILLGRRIGLTIDVEQMAIVPNAAPAEQRKNRYAIDPKMLLVWDHEARKHQLDVVGFVHSHPDHPPTPSATDADLAWPSYVYLIVSVIDGRASMSRAWQFDDVRREFVPVQISV